MKEASAPRPRSSASRALPSASRRPATTTRAPSWAKATAVARPMPVRAPVIKTAGVLMFLVLTVGLDLPAGHGWRRGTALWDVDDLSDGLCPSGFRLS